MKIPLLAYDPLIRELAHRYYPDLEILSEGKLPRRVLTCAPKPLLRASLPQVPEETVWLPHGQSDKEPCFEVLKEESAALVYGPQMRDWIRAKNPNLPIHQVGNFRLRYFEKHRSFYAPFFCVQHPCFLYAPTWDDYEKNNSFWTAFPALAQTLPEEGSLLIKLHPNTYKQFPEKVEILKGRYARPNIFWVEDFPPVYPLLAQADAYIGDMSSIGYDFLSQNKPLFFLSERETALSRCGLHVKPENVFAAYNSPDPFFRERKKLYEKTFNLRAEAVK